MPHASGSALYAEFAGVQITGDQRTMSWSSSINTIDTSAGSDADESHVTGTRNATISLSFLDNGTDGSAIAQKMYEGSKGTITWGPRGTAAGQPKYSCYATVTSVNDETPYDGEQVFDVEMLKNGAWLDNWKLNGDVWP